MNQQLIQKNLINANMLRSWRWQIFAPKLLRKTKLFFVILGLMFASWSKANTTENYLRNGDFEQELTHWGVWGLHPTTVNQVKNEAVSGEKSVLFSGRSDAKMIGLEQKQLPLKSGKTYSISLQLKTAKKLSDKVRILVGILERDKRGKVQHQGYQSLRLPENNKWTKSISDFTTSDAPCEYYQIVFRIDNLQDGEMLWLDNCELTELNPNAILERSSSKIEAATTLLKKWQNESSSYQRRSERTAVFARAQLKYGLERNDYLHKWIDRPLLVNPGLTPDNKFVNEAAYKIMRDVLKKYRMDGFAFFPETTGRDELYQHARQPGHEMTILTELIYNGSRDFSKKLELARIALENPQSMRLDGKVVFTSYPASDDLEFWGDFKKALIDNLGDHFIVMPYFKFFPEKFRKTGIDDTFSSDDLELLHARVREWLRVTDGYYHNTPGLKNRRYYAPIDREVIVPIIHSVLLEPEFKKKYLAWGVKVGHENYELLGYSMDQAGTGMLRGTMETAIMAKPDIINCVEWDEQNENTSFRPTLYNSWSTMRIMRYFNTVLNGKSENLPNDRMDIPNVILSYRKILVAGQILELELLNVPDNNSGSEVNQVQLLLRDIAGKEVKRFPWQKLQQNKLEAVTIEVPVEDIVKYQTLVPELIVKTNNGKEQVFHEGFQPVELRSSWNHDYKWVKHPLRDMLTPVKAELKIVGTIPDNRLRLQGKIESPELLNSVEIMDSGDVAYSHHRNVLFRENSEQYVINLNLQAKVPDASSKPVVLNGRIAFQNITPSHHLEVPSQVKYADNAWLFNNVTVSHRISQLYAVIPRKIPEASTIIIDLPGYCQAELPIAELLKKGVIGYPGPAGFNLVAKRFNSEIKLPNHWRQKTAEFEVVITPISQNSVLHLQAVGESGKVYRGKPISLYQPSGKQNDLTVYSVKHKRPVTFAIDRALITDFDYNFVPTHGSVLSTAGGVLASYGICGGYLPQVSGRGSGESLYGNAGPRTPGNQNRYPNWQQEPDGSWSLDFQKSYVSLPMALVPPFGPYEITMDVWPRDSSGTQTLLGCDFTGFMLLLKNGVPTVSIYLDNNYETNLPALATATGPTLSPDCWNQIKVRFDQRELSVEVNGKLGTKIKASGFQRYPKVFGLGVDQRRGNYFNGKIRSLKVKHENHVTK